MLAAALAVPLLLAGCGASNNPSMPEKAEQAQSPGGLQLRTTDPPWSVPSDEVRYIRAAGLPPLDAEQTVVHYHAHLDLLVDGKPVPVAAGIGIDESARKISPLHTHDTTGVVHIESANNSEFTLGQLFTEWDVRLNAHCIGGLCAGGNDGAQLRVAVDGQPYQGDPGRIVFKAHQEIAIQYGPPSSMKTPPASYDFPPGL